MNPFGLAWPLLKASDLIRVDETGTVVEGGENRVLNTAGRVCSYEPFNILTYASVHDPSRYSQRTF